MADTKKPAPKPGQKVEKGFTPPKPPIKPINTGGKTNDKKDK